MKVFACAASAVVLSMGWSSAFAASPTGLSSPQVYDANGAAVGLVIGAVTMPNGAAEILLNFNGKSFPVEVDKAGFTGGSGVVVFFQNSDCSGTGYISYYSYPGQSAHPFTNALVLLSAIVGPNQSVFVGNPTGTVAHNFAYQSYQEFPGPDLFQADVISDGSCMLKTGTLQDAFPTTRAGTLKAAFKPPFTIK